MPDTLNLEAQDLLNRMLSKDSANRLSLEQIRQHKWLQGFSNKIHEQIPVESDAISNDQAIESDILDKLETELNLDKH